MQGQQSPVGWRGVPVDFFSAAAIGALLLDYVALTSGRRRIQSNLAADCSDACPQEAARVWQRTGTSVGASARFT